MIVSEGGHRGQAQAKTSALSLLVLWCLYGSVLDELQPRIRGGQQGSYQAQALAQIKPVILDTFTPMKESLSQGSGSEGFRV